jgi:hypothetical protein
MLKGAQVDFQRQASAFETACTVYAPYYRQADAASRAALPQVEQDKIVGSAPTADGIAAFDYYIERYNNGRPFILEAPTVDGTNPVLLPGGLVINPIT